MIKIILSFVILIIFGYLFGNISNARILSKIIHQDITKMGSGNPGTMNMTRSFGTLMGFLTLVLDILKSVIPCLVAYFTAKYLLEGYVNILVYATGLSVVLGHIYPVFYKFKGGKGVASTIGIFFVLYPIWTLIFLAVGLIVLLIIQIGSITSFSVIFGLSVIGIIYNNSFIEIILISVILLIILFAHRENLKKLFTGKENRVKLFKKKQKTTQNSEEIDSQEKGESVDK